MYVQGYTCVSVSDLDNWLLRGLISRYLMISPSREQYKSTESWTGWRWKGSVEVTWTTALLKLEQVAQDHLQKASEYLHRGRLHHPPGQPIPVLSDSHSEKVLPAVQREPPVLQCVSVVAGPGHWAPPRRVWLFTYLQTWIRSVPLRQQTTIVPSKAAGRGWGETKHPHRFSPSGIILHYFILNIPITSD